MFAGVGPYPAYEDSGEPWLGQVPQGWQLRRTKTLLRERSDKGYPDEPPLAATQTKGVVRKDEYENRTVLALKDLHLLKLVREGDFVISLRSFQGGIEYARNQGIISPAYTVLYPRDPDVHAYLAWLFKSRPYIENLSLYVTGIRQGQNIDYERLGRSRLPIPPQEDRDQIARFLGHMDRRIRRYMAAKRALIALLNEQKQAVIHRAVTRGLGSNVRLKPSGVEWLGDIPSHWRAEKIKDLARGGYKTFVDGDWIESPYITDEGIRLIQTGNIGVGRYKEKGFRFISDATFYSLGCTEFSPNDVLICRLGEPVGRSCLAPDLGIRMITSVDVCMLKTRQDVVPAFVVAAMSSPRYLDWVGSLVRGSTRDRVSRSMLGSFRVPLPPHAEQVDIVRHLDAATSELDLAIGNAQNQIGLLREYRTRLIADVVTGKVDVRDAAAQLSDEVEEPELLNDADAMVEADESEVEVDQDGEFGDVEG